MPRENLLKRNFREISFRKASGLLDLAEETMRTGRPGLRASPFTGDFDRSPCLDFKFTRVELDGEATLLVVLADVSERRQAEEDLARADEPFRQMFDHMNSGVVIYEAVDGGSDFVIKEFNPAAELATKRPRADVLGCRVTGIFPDVTRFGLLAVFQRVWKTGIPERHPASLYEDERLAFWTENYVYRLPSGEIVAIFDDLTERKQLEESLRLTSFSVEHAGDGIIWLDCEGRISQVNDSLCTRLGYPREELMGMTIFDVTVDLQPEAWPARWLELKEHGPLTFEKHYRTKNGEIFPVEITSNILEHEGHEYNYGFVHDITKRKKTEEALLLTQLSVDGAADLIHWIGPDGCLLYVSDSTCRRHGYTQEELLGMTVFDLDPSMSPTAWKKHWREIKKRGSLVFESVHRAKDGEVFPLELTVNHVECDGQEYDFAFGRDISERKRAEEALRQANERLSLATVAGGVGTWDLDVVNNKLTWDDQMFRLYGMEPGSFGGAYETWKASVHPEDRERGDAEVQMALRGEKEFDTEFRVIWPSGAIHHIRARAQVHRDAAGRPMRLIGTNYDITERKQMEESLRRTQFAVDQSQDLVHWVDSEGRFLYVNDASCRRLGYSREELLGMTVYDIDPGAPRPWSSHFKEIRERGSFTFESAHQTKDGEIYPVEVTVNYVNYEGQEYNCASARDISERKQAEEEKARLEDQLRQAQKMESVGRLAGGVAHDFNNMLGVILGHAEMALDQVDSAQPLHGDLTEIRQAAERSADLTRQLLAFARKQTVAPQVLDLNETVAGMLNMLKRLIGEDIDLCWQPQPDLWPVKVDPSQIDQILANLCINARDAIAEVGKTTIETGNSIVDKAYCRGHPGLAPGEYVRLAVSDDGCGMDKETLSHLFEPFFTTKGVGQGTGLGLATVYGIVKQNNGFTDVHSELGKGTTFTIYLPRQVAKAEHIRKESPTAPAARGRETVLLVEDEPAILNMITRMLETRGYTVLAAGTPGEAIRLAREHAGEIHLLLTDVVMPEMNGRALAKNLLSLYPHLKRLFMSGYTADVIARQGVLDDGVHFIQKPFSTKNLSAKVREALEGE
jgi:PAS domain S-box-containing protein